MEKRDENRDYESLLPPSCLSLANTASTLSSSAGFFSGAGSGSGSSFGAVVTDAGSTKQAIVAEAARSLKRCAFLGGHPMAGKELRGAAAHGRVEHREWQLRDRGAEMQQPVRFDADALADEPRF